MSEKRIHQATGWMMVALVAYGIGYSLLIVRGLPSVGRDGQLEFRSSPRVGPGVIVNQGISIVHGRTSILNYLFYPVQLRFASRSRSKL
jgi:hypothetical protein